MNTKTMRAAWRTFVACCFLAASFAAHAAGMKTYAVSRFNVQISCPVDWRPRGLSATDLFTDYTGPDNTIGFTAPDGHGSLFVSVIRTRRLNTAEFFRTMIGMAQRRNVSAEVKSFELNGIWGFDAVYGEGSKDGRTRVVAFYQGGRRYTIMLAGFDNGPGMYAKNTPMLDAIIHSFRILK